jgi:hypothetical protein
MPAVVSCHFHKNIYLEELLETNILFLINNGGYNWTVNSGSKAPSKYQK